VAQCRTCGNSVDERTPYCSRCGTPDPAHAAGAPPPGTSLQPGYPGQQGQPGQPGYPGYPGPPPPPAAVAPPPWLAAGGQAPGGQPGQPGQPGSWGPGPIPGGPPPPTPKLKKSGSKTAVKVIAGAVAAFLVIVIVIAATSGSSGDDDPIAGDVITAGTTNYEEDLFEEVIDACVEGVGSDNPEASASQVLSFCECTWEDAQSAGIPFSVFTGQGTGETTDGATSTTSSGVPAAVQAVFDGCDDELTAG
jgi:hypothetical protein